MKPFYVDPLAPYTLHPETPSAAGEISEEPKPPGERGGDGLGHFCGAHGRPRRRGMPASTPSCQECLCCGGMLRPRSMHVCVVVGGLVRLGSMAC